eukprot:6571982-Pyramimonas_sp.AAC.1
MHLLNQVNSPAPAHGHDAEPELELRRALSQTQLPPHRSRQVLRLNRRQGEVPSRPRRQLALIETHLNVSGAEPNHVGPVALDGGESLGAGKLGAGRSEGWQHARRRSSEACCLCAARKTMRSPPKRPRGLPLPHPRRTAPTRRGQNRSPSVPASGLDSASYQYKIQTRSELQQDRAISRGQPPAS